MKPLKKAKYRLPWGFLSRLIGFAVDIGPQRIASTDRLIGTVKPLDVEGKEIDAQKGLGFWRHGARGRDADRGCVCRPGVQQVQQPVRLRAEEGRDDEHQRVRDRRRLRRSGACLLRCPWQILDATTRKGSCTTRTNQTPPGASSPPTPLIGFPAVSKNGRTYVVHGREGHEVEHGRDADHGQLRSGAQPRPEPEDAVAVRFRSSSATTASSGPGPSPRARRTTASGVKVSGQTACRSRSLTPCAGRSCRRFAMVFFCPVPEGDSADRRRRGQDDRLVRPVLHRRASRSSAADPDPERTRTTRPPPAAAARDHLHDERQRSDQSLPQVTARADRTLTGRCPSATAHTETDASSTASTERRSATS